MSKGPNGAWRPPDTDACAAHVARILTGESVARILTGESEETFEAPGTKRPAPPDPAAGGRARASKMTAGERPASAKRAAAARWSAS